MPLKKQKKYTEKADKKTEQEQLIQATINSNYSLLIPKINAEYVSVRNPLDATIKSFAVNSSGLVDHLKMLCGLGLTQKLMNDFIELRQFDSKWEDVMNNLQDRGAFSNE
jgi:hypothetical protein